MLAGGCTEEKKTDAEKLGTTAKKSRIFQPTGLGKPGGKDPAVKPVHLLDPVRLLGNSFYRKRLVHKLFNLVYPWSQPLVSFYRRTVLRNIKIVTVIGSLGKSTTCRAIAEVLGDHRLEGYGNHRASVIRNLVKHPPWSSWAVLEVGINGEGQMSGYASMLEPDIVVVTSIASEHILTFKSLERIRQEKSEMLRALSPDQTAVLNADDPNVAWMANRTQAQILTFGIENPADIKAEKVSISPPGGMEFEVSHHGDVLRLRIPFLGRHMVYPALAALAVASGQGINLKEAAEILEKTSPAKARMQAVELPSGAILIRDDYKATRESVWRALETLEEYPAERKILVLGGVSEITNQERYQFYRDLGKRIAQSSDFAVLHLQRNAFKKCQIGAKGASSQPKQLVRTSADPLSILDLLPSNLGKGDVLLIKGKTDYKVSRLALALMGRNVNCRLLSCRQTIISCEGCSMLENGWNGKQPIPFWKH